MATAKLDNPGASIYSSLASVEARSMATQQVIIDVPEQVLLAEKTDSRSFGREMQMLSAVKLYELGRLTSGRAAELAGLSRLQFLQSLGRYKVFPLEAELSDLEAAHG